MIIKCAEVPGCLCISVCVYVSSAQTELLDDHAKRRFFCSRMHQLGVLKTTVQLVFEYKVGKYVFGRQNTPSTHIVLNIDSND
jgi:hypothetical protein